MALPLAVALAAALLAGSDERGPALRVPLRVAGAMLVGLPLVTGAVTWLCSAVAGRSRRDLSAAALAAD